MNIDTQFIIELAQKAGQAIMEIYDTVDGIFVESKLDNSPLTNADIAAHETIISGLRLENPNIPIVSEEGKIGNPKDSDFSWLVDPLDGTKEFIKRNGMFTVNIALMKKNKSRWDPIIGVVHSPVSNKTWFGNTEKRIAELTENDSQPRTISVSKTIDSPIQLVASGSHRNDRDELFAEALGAYELIRMGSSLKACIVAEGSAHLYPRFGPTSCWDIAAAHAVVSAAGGILVGPDGRNLRYDILDKILNPYFLVACSSKWNSLWINNQD